MNRSRGSLRLSEKKDALPLPNAGEPVKNRHPSIGSVSAVSPVVKLSYFKAGSTRICVSSLEVSSKEITRQSPSRRLE